MTKISWKKKNNSILRKVSKLKVVKCFSPLSILVDLNNFFLMNLLELKFGIHIINLKMIV